MIERATVNGRPALVAYLNNAFSPVDEADADIVKVVFTDDEGGSAFLVPAEADIYLRDVGWTEEAREAALEARRAKMKPEEAPKGHEKSASDLLQIEEHITPEHIIASVPGAREKLTATEQRLKHTVPTDALVLEGGHKNSDGSWTRERSAIHDAILRDTFTVEAIAAATPKAGEQPVLHLLGGRGGSGKSWFTGSEGTVDRGKALYVNSDDFKAMLPEYKGWNAPNLHEESSYLGKRIESIARENKLNVILDGTMKDTGSLLKRMDAYEKAGYRIEGHYMYTSPANSAKRALERFVRGGETGRLVSPEYSLGSTTNEQSFDSVRHRMDKWEIYDNNGKVPVFHARGGKH